jgi:hypothetical protein
MRIVSYGDPSIQFGHFSDETMMAGRRKCNDCDDCNDVFFCFCDEDDCDNVVYCGYDSGYCSDNSSCYCDEDDCDPHCEYDD